MVTAAASGPNCSRTAAPSPPAAGRTFPRGAVSFARGLAGYCSGYSFSLSASVNRTKMHIVCGRQTVDPPTSAIIVMFVVVVVLGGVAWC